MERLNQTKNQSESNISHIDVLRLKVTNKDNSSESGGDRQRESDHQPPSNSEGSNLSREDGQTKSREKKQKRIEEESTESYDLKITVISNDSNLVGGGEDNAGEEETEFSDDRAKYIARILNMYNACVADVSGKTAHVSPQLKEDIHRLLSEDTHKSKRFRKIVDDSLKRYNDNKSISERQKKYFIELHGFAEERYGYIRNKIESKRFAFRQFYARTHSAELRKIEKTIHYQFIDQKYQKFATIESKRANDAMIKCLRELQLEGEMNDPGLYSLLIKHGEHVRKIAQTTIHFLVDMDALCELQRGVREL